MVFQYIFDKNLLLFFVVVVFVIITISTEVYYYFVCVEKVCISTTYTKSFKREHWIKLWATIAPKIQKKNWAPCLKLKKKAALLKWKKNKKASSYFRWLDNAAIFQEWRYWCIWEHDRPWCQRFCSSSAFFCQSKPIPSAWWRCTHSEKKEGPKWDYPWR